MGVSGGMGRGVVMTIGRIKGLGYELDGYSRCIHIRVCVLIFLGYYGTVTFISFWFAKSAEDLCSPLLHRRS